MNREEILKQCCNDTCTWDNQISCHMIKICNINLSINDIKFLSTIKVHTLDLYNNKIGDDGVKYLAENKMIHTLDLSENNIGDNGAKYLAGNKTIHTLILSHNRIRDNGAKYFVNAIIPKLKLSYKYRHISKISKNNYIQETRGVILQYIIKDITCIIINYIL